MAAKTIPDYPRGITFEQVWAALMETDRIVKENAKEMREYYKKNDKEMREYHKKHAEEMREYQKKHAKEMREYQKKNAKEIEETNRQMKETDRQMKETDRQMKETDKRLDKQLGKLGSRFGEMVEYMVVPNLITKFGELGFVFEKAYQNATIKDRKNNIFAETDITLENGDKVMIVEVKTKPTTEDFTDHVERITKVKAHAEKHGDKRKFLGAVAGMVFNNNEKLFAMKNGFYVIEPSGETFKITPPNGQPKEW